MWKAVEQRVKLQVIWDVMTPGWMNAVMNQKMMLGEIRGLLTHIQQVIGQVYLIKYFFLLFVLTHWVLYVRSTISHWRNTNQGISRDALGNTGLISSLNTLALWLIWYTAKTKYFENTISTLDHTMQYNSRPSSISLSHWSHVLETANLQTTFYLHFRIWTLRI